MYHSEKNTRVFIEKLLSFYKKHLKKVLLTNEEFKSASLVSASNEERFKYFTVGRTIFIDIALFLVLPSTFLGLLTLTARNGVNIFTFLSFLLYLIPLCIGLSFGAKKQKSLKEITKYTKKDLLTSIIFAIFFAFASTLILAAGVG